MQKTIVKINHQGWRNHGGYEGYSPAPKVPINRASPTLFVRAGYEKIPILLHVRHHAVKLTLCEFYHRSTLCRYLARSLALLE